MYNRDRGALLTGPCPVAYELSTTVEVTWSRTKPSPRTREAAAATGLACTSAYQASGSCRWWLGAPGSLRGRHNSAASPSPFGPCVSIATRGRGLGPLGWRLERLLWWHSGDENGFFMLKERSGHRLEFLAPSSGVEDGNKPAHEHQPDEGEANDSNHRVTARPTWRVEMLRLMPLSVRDPALSSGMCVRQVESAVVVAREAHARRP